MIRLGLLGHPVGHSLSPAIHTAALSAHGLQESWRYDAFDVTTAALPLLLARLRPGRWRGVNLTHPLKLAVLPYLAATVGPAAGLAVNTIVVEPDGRLVGHNTDGDGLLRTLGPLPLRGDVVLLGAGGAARAIALALTGVGLRVGVVSRRPAPALELLAACPATGRGAALPWADQRATRDALARATLLVQCTPLGAAAPRGSAAEAAALAAFSVLPLAALDRGTQIIDIVYTPALTPLLRLVGELGCTGRGGLEMLVAQAASAYELWTGRRAPLTEMARAADRELARREGAGGAA